MIAPRVLVIALGIVSCGGEAESEPRVTHGETELSCGNLACREEMAAVRFVNSAAARRTVAVDGVVQCELEPADECVVLVEPSVEVVVHVSAEDDSSPCSGDPRATLGVCACATFEILC